MQTVTLARNEIGPLLDELIIVLEHNGCVTQKRHFNRIRRAFNKASDELELTSSMVQLASGQALGLALPQTADVLMARILEKTAHLTEELAGVATELH